MSTTNEVQILAESDIVRTRQAIREAATECGFGLTDTTRIVTAASELSRNIFLYAGTGKVAWKFLSGARRGIEIAFVDEGPGIPDLDKALQPGFTTGRGMGLGLSGSKRLMDELSVETEVGSGTTVTVRKWLRDL